MEAFSLLKYWRGRATGDTTTTDSNTTNVIAEVSESDEEVNADDGPFFDMEFMIDGDDKEKRKETEGFDDIKESDEDSDECDCENEAELKFTLSPASSGDSIDHNISLSPCDDLFFKGKLVPLTDSDTNIKPVSKSATKLRVLMLKFKKSTKLSVAKTVESELNKDSDVIVESEKEDIRPVNKQSAKFFTVKFKGEEVPVLSMFTRDNSSKVPKEKLHKQNTENEKSKSSTIEEEEKVFGKDMVNKYLKKVKPLYVRVSKRYGGKLGFSGHLNLSKRPNVTELTQKQGELTQLKTLKQGISLPSKLRVARKHLGKSKSASSTVTAAVDSPPVVMVSKRRDDSLLQQQDGIQSAIMHCKTSFKASRELEGNKSVSTADLSCSVDKAKGDMH